MPSHKDIDAQRQQLVLYRENVQILLGQIAQNGGMTSAPLGMLNSLREARATIVKCKSVLRGWGLAVEELPDDSEHSQVLLEATYPRAGSAPACGRGDGARPLTTAQGQLRLDAHNALQPLGEPSDGTPVQIGVTHLIAYTGPPKPSELSACLALERAYLSEVALRYAEWRARYAPLPLRATPAPAARGYEREHLFFEALRSSGAVQRVVSFTDLREGLRECGDMLLLGPPGAGKTTALWRLALDLAEDGLYRNPGAQLPVFVRLGGLQEGQPLLARLQADLATATVDDGQGRSCPLPAHQALAPLIPRLLEQGRLVLLWDGLNETPERLFVETARQLALLRRRHARALGQICTHHVITCRAEDHERLVALCNGADPLVLAQATLQGLDQATVRQIVLRRLGDRRGGELLSALEAPAQRTLAGLARTPLLLTMLCAVYESHGVLPDTRGRLLAQFVQARVEWEHQRAPDAWIDSAVQMQALAQLAYAMTESQGRGTSVAWQWARQRLADAAPGVSPGALLARARASDLLEVVARGEQVRFTHQLIQEYFAALALRGRLRDFVRVRQVSALLGWWQARRYAAPQRRTGWEETLLLLAGIEGESSIAHQLVRTFLAQPLDAARLLLAGGSQPDPALLDEVRGAALAQICDAAHPRAARLSAGAALGLVGDPRLLDLRTGDAPKTSYWCPVEAGPFWFGNDRTEPFQQIEQPCGFKVARLPVTNAEYRRFIDAGGYDPQQPWWRVNGRAWLLPGGHPYTQEHSDQPITRPRLWHDARFNQPSQPVVGVSWYEVRAFCTWLTVLGHTQGWLPQDDVIRLPTWREWQRAARHTDQRCYPWGDAPPDPERANYTAVQIKHPAPVGCFPAGQAACGALDLVGNVWEWTATPWSQVRQLEPLGDIGQREPILIAGGSFLSRDDQLDGVARNWSIPGVRSLDRGFRLVWSPSRWFRTSRPGADEERQVFA